MNEESREVIRLSYGANSDAREPRWPLTEINNCEQILNDSKSEAVGEDGFREKIANGESSSSVSGVVFSKKSDLAALRRQMAMSSLQAMFSSLQDV